MIAVIDYGMGNLRSVEKALATLGAEVVVSGDPELVKRAAGVVLPGVGAFGDAMDHLQQLGLDAAIRDVAAAGTPLLGICLGMQLLFSSSEEHGLHQGLNLIPGQVKQFQGDFKIPHIGWNDLTLHRESLLLQGVENGDYVYWVHSLFVEPADRSVVLATTGYYGEVPGIVGRGNVWGIQFHPEKSSRVGLQLLSNFVKLVREGATA
ncbi:glutamine amidotransferase [Tumebacillus sp. BK434]|uniref:imidazole glycerol phosphate synthase subunit HisH n=1 Tax=Tumebacillus sp. BK434 TaxID=2512169 RepID=UPI001042E878|nr:imidazole glycerol phosphate synthase subunit HisH [Tumebacillus sp. BK434]TCP55880.1 glutamine amidotransferase [Tumebacillus sp. BK434]